MQIEQLSRVRPWTDEAAVTRRRIALLIAGGVAATLLAAWHTSTQRLHQALDNETPVVMLDKVVVTGKRLPADTRVAAAPAAVVR